jgi:hypothetical protein
VNDLDKACLAYIKELEENYHGSHLTLHGLYVRFGKEKVQKWLDEHFTKEKEK